jgi:adenylate kinase family enzyme
MKLETKKAVIAFSGKVGSGKTTLSTQLARMLEWEWVSFSTFIRKMAIENNLGEDRRTLQDLGAHLLGEGLELFCLNVLNQINWQNSSFIIDGIRHKEVLDFLKQAIKPIPLFHIHIAISKDTQVERIEKRISEKNIIDYIEDHSTEFQIQQILPESADLILNSALSIDHLLEDILAFLRAKGILL